jgi:sulfur-carrier protein
MHILLFGIIREIAGKSKLALPSDADLKTVSDVKRWMAQQYPQIASLTSMAVAVDSEYAEDDQALTPDSEIALIPPVSGG